MGEWSARIFLVIGLMRFGLVLGSRLVRVWAKFRSSPNGPKRFEHYNQKNKNRIIIKIKSEGTKMRTSIRDKNHTKRYVTRDND